MTVELALLLAQDGVANGAIYALVALGIVLLFLVTRIIFVPFGDLVAYASLTLAAIQSGQRPGLVWLVLGLAGLAFISEAAGLLRRGQARRLPRAALLYLALPAVPAAAAWWLAGPGLPQAAQTALTLALVLPLGPLLYRIAFRPIADAPVLVLLMVSVVLHFALSGIALVVFGPEGGRPLPLTDAMFDVGGMVFPGQMLLVLAASVLAAIGLFAYFGFTAMGRALRATAVNRTGARLVGIRPGSTGAVAFLLGAGIAALSGILIGPSVTMTYDSGFILGLKAFVGAIIGGLVSYPGAVLGALFVGLLESFTAFYNSAVKDMVVFALLVPVLILRSLLPGAAEDDADPEEM